MKWEYKEVVTDCLMHLSELNELGKQEWELVTMTTCRYKQVSTIVNGTVLEGLSYIYYFKRLVK